MINWFEKNKAASVIMIILISIEIFYISSLPGSVEVGGNEWIAITYHFTIFFLLTFFIFTSIMKNEKIKLRKVLFVVLISLIYALLDEIHQIFVPLRDASIRDILIDSIGIFFATAIYIYTKRNN
ncbi:MAG: VanZ family protein [Nanoarchaeota archaeon]|nr:VanZ family protein [Nanoarchaeota archaeon]